MKFELSTAGNYYSKEEVKELEKLGFEFIKDSNYISGEIYRIVRNTSIEINSLDELIEFSGKYGELIFDANSIIIYNDYIE